MIIVWTIIIIILITSVLLLFNCGNRYLYYSEYHDPEGPKLSAMEAYDLALVQANKWDNDSYLTTIISLEIARNGKATKWYFEFEINNSRDEIHLHVKGNGKIKQYIKQNMTISSADRPILNWTYDSVDLIKILKLEPNFKGWKEADDWTNLDRISIGMDGNNNFPSCGIKYRERGRIGGHPAEFNFLVNGKTGEIIKAPYHRLIEGITTGKSLLINNSEVGSINFENAGHIISNYTGGYNKDYYGYEWNNHSQGYLINYTAEVNFSRPEDKTMMISILYDHNSGESWVNAQYYFNTQISRNEEISYEKQSIIEKTNEIAIACNITINWDLIYWEYLNYLE